ncbi:MAG: uroporphyrinogen decarboxylase [Planctomycetaceae bacterium]|nr:uroporphyrinogen decarboxylase [Planctomycetaceae bacterium]
MNGYERLMGMMKGEAVDHVPLMPITMMFAGDLAGIPYGQYAADHRKLVEAQLKTAEQFEFDYVSCISDPAREAADCGARVQFYDNQPPAIDETRALLADKKVLAGLKAPDPLGGGRMHDRVQAAALFRQRVGGQLLIEGWIEGPCAEAADLRGINSLMVDFFDDPAFVRDLFEFVVEMELAFAKAQIEAGVDILGMGDAAASLVGPQIYREFVLPYERRMIDGIHDMGGRVRLHICGNTSKSLKEIGSLKADLVDLDFMVSVAAAREAMGPDQVLTGNIDPVTVVRNGTPEGVTAGVAQCHQDAGRNYVVAAGCEIPRDTRHENVAALTQYAKSHTP